MAWNHRLFKIGENGDFSLGECYYDKKDSVEGWIIYKNLEGFGDEEDYKQGLKSAYSLPLITLSSDGESIIKEQESVSVKNATIYKCKKCGTLHTSKNSVCDCVDEIDFNMELTSREAYPSTLKLGFNHTKWSHLEWCVDPYFLEIDGEGIGLTEDDVEKIITSFIRMRKLLKENI